MKTLLEGRKTWIGLVLIVLGFVGLPEITSEAQLNQLIELTSQLAGILIAIYGNYKSHKKIGELGGYRPVSSSK